MMIRLVTLLALLTLTACQQTNTPPTSPAPDPVPIGGMCGGIAGLQCVAEGVHVFCDYPVSAQCGAADQMGVCREGHPMCTREYMPVCGCDGQTYGNACEARANMVSVAHESVCEER